MLAKRVEMQNTKKALFEATKETKESKVYDTIKKAIMLNYRTQK